MLQVLKLEDIFHDNHHNNYLPDSCHLCILQLASIDPALDLSTRQCEK